MLHITLGDWREVEPATDELGRSYIGYKDGMTVDDMWESNRGCWVLGERADSERFVVFSHQGVVRMVAEIESIDPTTSKRRVLTGRPLSAGDRAFDVYIDGPAPVQGNRNPITYFDDLRFDRRECACGCGEQITRGDWIPGHDQKALHARVASIGTVKEFVDWFDRTAVTQAV